MPSYLLLQARFSVFAPFEIVDTQSVVLFLYFEIFLCLF